MIMEDLHELRQMGSAEQFSEAWDGTMGQLLGSEIVADMLGRIDPAVMRAAFWSGQWGDAVESSFLHEDTAGKMDCCDEGAYICEMMCKEKGEDRVRGLADSSDEQARFEECGEIQHRHQSVPSMLQHVQEHGCS